MKNLTPFLKVWGFLYLYDMKKLIENILRQYVLESRKYPKKKGEVKHRSTNYKIISTFHQWFERHGDNSYLENVDLFYNKNMGDNNYRIGVSDSLLIPIIQEYIDKIIQGFVNFNPCNKRIIFAYKRNNNDEDFFNTIEFILQKENNDLLIITSALSEDGYYLYYGVKPRSSHEKLNEEKCNDDLIMINL